MGRTCSFPATTITTAAAAAAAITSIITATATARCLDPFRGSNPRMGLFLVPSTASQMTAEDGGLTDLATSEIELRHASSAQPHDSDRLDDGATRGSMHPSTHTYVQTYAHITYINMYHIKSAYAQGPRTKGVAARRDGSLPRDTNVQLFYKIQLCLGLTCTED